MAAFWNARHLAWPKFTDVSHVLADSIARALPEDGGRGHVFILAESQPKNLLIVCFKY
jgi:hypothetical protein